MNTRVFRFMAALAVLTLCLLPGRAVFAQRVVAPKVAPTDGVPGVSFVFTAPGFQGAVPDEDAADNGGERVVYWINLPTGQVIDTAKHEGKGADDDTYTPLATDANGHGEVTIRWTSPGDAPAGPYSLVMHGTSSEREVVLPFTIHPDGWQTVVQTNVTPKVGQAGGEFNFIATGFNGAFDKKDRRGEQVAYWFNTPNGTVIGTEERAEKNDRGNDTRRLLHYADEDGVVNLVWSAPANLKPGLYSVVFHGLDSHNEVVMFFTVK